MANLTLIYMFTVGLFTNVSNLPFSSFTSLFGQVWWPGREVAVASTLVTVVDLGGTTAVEVALIPTTVAGLAMVVVADLVGTMVEVVVATDLQTVVFMATVGDLNISKRPITMLQAVTILELEDLVMALALVIEAEVPATTAA